MHLLSFSIRNDFQKLCITIVPTDMFYVYGNSSIATVSVVALNTQRPSSQPMSAHNLVSPPIFPLRPQSVPLAPLALLWFFVGTIHLHSIFFTSCICGSPKRRKKTVQIKQIQKKCLHSFWQLSFRHPVIVLFGKPVELGSPVSCFHKLLSSSSLGTALVKIFSHFWLKRDVLS